MAKRLKPIDLNEVRTCTVRRRQYQLGIEQLGSVPVPTEPLQDFYHHLPKTGHAAGMLRAAQWVAQTALDGRPMVCLIDGAALRAGLSPLLIYLIQRGMIQCLVMNGRAALHDYELAFHGAAAEDASAGVTDGLLGLARETGEGLNAIINEGVKRGFSIGECLGRGILDRQPKHFKQSLLATGAARLTPTTVHLTLGAEGFQRYPGVNGGLLGKGSLKDCLILSSLLSKLPHGGLIVALHRDEALSQAFIHAVALARNVSKSCENWRLLALGDACPLLTELPGSEPPIHLPGPLELTLPLLLGAVFSLVE